MTDHQRKSRLGTIYSAIKYNFNQLRNTEADLIGHMEVLREYSKKLEKGIFEYCETRLPSTLHYIPDLTIGITFQHYLLDASVPFIADYKWREFTVSSIYPNIANLGDHISQCELPSYKFSDTQEFLRRIQKSVISSASNCLKDYYRKYVRILEKLRSLESSYSQIEEIPYWPHYSDRRYTPPYTLEQIQGAIDEALMFIYKEKESGVRAVKVAPKIEEKSDE